MKLLRVSMVWACLHFCICCCEAQNQLAVFRYMPVPEKYLVLQDKNMFKSEITEAKRTSFDLTKTLPAGYVKNGTVDYTSYLQAGLDKNRNVTFPAFPVLINEKGLNIRSNSKVVFPDGAALIMKPNALKSYEIIRIREAEDVDLYSPVIIGDRKQHMGTDGEWGMGIDIRASKNVRIINPSIKECWGDGIYLGQMKNTINSNIAIYNAVLDFNRRNGISVICVNGLQLVHPVISNTTGASPMTAIDIEPNSPANVIDNINISSPVTFNNSKCGILLALRALTNSNKQHNVNITINGHVDEGSFIAFNMGWFKPDKQGLPLGGNIKVTDAVWKNNVEAFRARKTYDYCPAILFKNISIQKDEAYKKNIQQARGNNMLKTNNDNDVLQKFIKGERKIKIE
jgi:hypothetical protein